MSCDLCGSTGSVEELTSDYKTEGVGHVCSKCRTDLTDQMWKIRSYQTGVMKTLVRRYIQNKHEDLITLELKQRGYKPLFTTY